MQRAWLVLNPGSGSTSDASSTAVAEALTAHGVAVAGTSTLPGDVLPTRAALDSVQCDTLVVMGGDGTVNAATARLDDFAGACLILPGGTMNMLAKALHGDAGWADIVARAAAGENEPVTLPCAVAGEQRALVGVIVGPVAAWFHARERWRRGRLAGVARAALFAWRRSFSTSVIIAGRAGRHRAVVVTPHRTGLEVAAFSARSWRQAVSIGWQWLAGDWRQAPGVDICALDTVTIGGRDPVGALFDGELVKLPSPLRLRHAMTRLRFIATVAAH